MKIIRNPNLKVSIVIPNYNGVALLRENLPKIITALKNKKNKILEIIIVDNGSTDTSVSFIRNNFPKIRLIKHRKNRFFSAAVNTGVRSAKSEYICLLNNDVAPRSDFLESVLPHFKDKDVFAVSLYEEGGGADRESWTKGIFEKGFIVHKSGSGGSKAHDTFWVNGGSGIFRRDMWMKLRGMDEKLLSPFYWEDVDLSYRAQKRGWKLLWEPNAKVTHKAESTIGKLPKKYREKIQQRNQLIFIWKNLTSLILFRKHILGLLVRISHNPGYLKIVLMALVKIKLIRKVRKKEKKQSKVSDEAIFARFR